MSMSNLSMSSLFITKPTQCSACNMEAEFVPDGLVPCDKCRKAYYCSSDCKLWHWKQGGHAKDCPGKNRGRRVAPAIREDKAVFSDDKSLDLDDIIGEERPSGGIMEALEKSRSQLNATKNKQSAKSITYNNRSLTVFERWSVERVDDVARLWKLTPDQKKGLAQLGSLVADIDHWKNDPYEIIRFYLEFKGHLPKVEHMFRATIQWRKDHDIENHLERYGTPDPLFHYFPVGILDGATKDGHAVYLDRIGAADSWGIIQQFGGIPAVVDYMIFFYEHIQRRDFWRHWEYTNQRRVTNCYAVIDVHGLNVGHMRPGLLPCLQKVSRVTQDYYSGWACKIFLLRAPPIFKYIWSIAKYFFDAHIREMIIFTSDSDYLEVLSKHMDLEILPPCVAPGVGKGKGMPGYFENIVWEGGHIPSRQEDAKRRPGTKHKQPLHSYSDPVEHNPKYNHDNPSPSKPGNNKSFATATTWSSSTSSSSTNSHTGSPSVKVLTRSIFKGHWETNGETDDFDESTTSNMTTISAYRSDLKTRLKMAQSHPKLLASLIETD